MILLAQPLAASFVAAPVCAAGLNPDSVAAADFNGDGIPDLAVAYYGSYPSDGDGGVTILLGNGDGTFQASSNYKVGAQPLAVAVGDFNNDGKLDLLTVNGNTTMSVLFGNGDGTFQPAPNFATGLAGLYSVAVGDFNGDGKLDVVVASTTKNLIDSVSILLGNGDGTFQSPQNYPLEFARFVAVGDFNRDGNLDVAALGSVGLEIFLGNGDGTLQPGLIYPVYGQAAVVGDFNGDGIPDLAVAGGDVGVPGSVAIVLGNGDGMFQLAQTYTVSSPPLSVALADFNHDGHVDLAVGTAYGLVSILLGNGDGTFQTPQDFATGTIASSLAAADLNGDGHLDLASTDRSGVFILLGNGDGTLQAARVYAAELGGPVSAVAVGDFNGDGIPDFAVVNGPHNATLSIFLGNGDGTFRLGPRYAPSYVAGNPPVSIVVADVNGDGIPDLAVLEGAVQIWLGNGDGSFQAPQGYAVGFLHSPTFLTAADLNGDGFPDLIVAGAFRNGSLSVLLNHGDGTFEPPQSYPSGGVGTYSVAVADFNGDGIPDLAVGTQPQPNVGPLRILFGNGDGTFQAAQNYSLGFGYSSEVIVRAADFNGDGHADLAIADNQSVTVLLGNGDGTFQAPQNYPGYGPLALGDFNRDGFLDLITSQNSSSIGVLLGKGDGTFHAVPGCSVGIAIPVAVGDFNGDGYPDLAGSYAGGVVILLNAADW